MQTRALILRKSQEHGPTTEGLTDLCRTQGFQVSTVEVPEQPDAFKQVLHGEPCVVFLPVLEEDCLGVKLTQLARDDGVPRAIILYGQSLPSSQYLCLAFRAGVDDVLSLDLSPDALAVQITRAERLLTARIHEPGNAVELRHKIESLEHACKNLARRNAKWEERLLMLATATGRLATGELRLAESPPPLLIAATSRSQAATASDLATRLGFTVRTVHTGREALATLTDHPPRVILTDGTLPDMDAKTLARSARRTLGDKPVVIIAWSSNPKAEAELLGPDTGIDDFVLKSATSEGGGFLVAALIGSLR